MLFYVAFRSFQWMSESDFGSRCSKSEKPIELNIKNSALQNSQLPDYAYPETMGFGSPYILLSVMVTSSGLMTGFAFNEGNPKLWNSQINKKLRQQSSTHFSKLKPLKTFARIFSSRE